MSESIAVVITTVESSDDADRLAQTLLDQRLAACVQIDGPIVSHYRWEGKQQQAREFRLLIKVDQALWPRLERALAECHPYDEPEIILLPIAACSAGYRSWVLEQTAD